MAGKRGPKVPPIEMQDGHGTYLLYVSRHCKSVGCGVQLTSRNRDGLRLLCLKHGWARDRERKGGRAAHGSRPDHTNEIHTNPNQDPKSREAHSLLDRFLHAPLRVERLNELQALLVDISLVHHFRNIN